MDVRFVSNKPDTRRIPRHTEAQWEKVKPTIIDLYFTKHLPLQEVRRNLYQQFNFDARLDFGLKFSIFTNYGIAHGSTNHNLLNGVCANTVVVKVQPE